MEAIIEAESLSPPLFTSRVENREGGANKKKNGKEIQESRAGPRLISSGNGGDICNNECAEEIIKTQHFSVFITKACIL